MLRAGIYSPYWDTLGGGEKYVAAVAMVLRNQGYEVDLFWHENKLVENIQQRYDFELSKVKVNKDGYKAFNDGNLWDRFVITKNFDVFVYVSDGSFPFLFAKKSIIHFQVPFSNHKKSVSDYFKKYLIDDIVCNSKFTKRVIDKEFGLKSRVVYPPTTQIGKGEKHKYILSVGRFDNLMHSKRQDALVDIFGKMKIEGWKLVLAGGLLHGKKQLMKLKKSAGKGVEFVVNPTWKELARLFSHASIYWHAAGYGEDVSKNPERAEHFGISTVEAMSAGSVPVVFDAGGQREIVTHGKNGYLWRDKNEVIKYTTNLIEDEVQRNKMSEVSMKRSQDFSLEVFEREFKKIIG